MNGCEPGSEKTSGQDAAVLVPGGAERTDAATPADGDCAGRRDAADDIEDAEQADAESKPRPRIRRRVKTEPVPGSDPTPAPEPPRHSKGENDEQLKRDKPPHWG